MTSLPDRTCALCGRDNDCGAARGAATCWCWAATFAPGVLARAALQSDETCLCPACARGEIPSPCIGVCQLDAATRTCRGCARTIDEVAAWPVMDMDEKIAVLRRLRGNG